MSEETEYNSFTMRVICTAANNQKTIVNRIYEVLGNYNIESADSEQREKGKYCIYKIPVRIDKDFELKTLYNDLGKIDGIKTVI